MELIVKCQWSVVHCGMVDRSRHKARARRRKEPRGFASPDAKHTRVEASKTWGRGQGAKGKVQAVREIRRLAWGNCLDCCISYLMFDWFDRLVWLVEGLGRNWKAKEPESRRQETDP
jgi:hypothetical protein